MEKDIGKIKKKDDTDIVIRIDDFGGKIGLTIREFVTSDRYTGFTKAGTRIPAEKFLDFREIINSIKLEDLRNNQETEEAVEEAIEEEEKEEVEPKEQPSKDNLSKDLDSMEEEVM